MAFRSPENVQRNELVRFDLESVIIGPRNTQEREKRGYKFTVEDRGIFFLIGITLFSKFSLKWISKLMAEIMLILFPQLLMVHIHLLKD